MVVRVEPSPSFFNRISKLWSDFHFSAFQRVVKALPVVPDQPMGVIGRPSINVFPVEVTTETVIEPPAALPFLGAVMSVTRILVHVLSTESLTAEIVLLPFGVGEAIT